jgi:hypothetical protein
MDEHLLDLELRFLLLKYGRERVLRALAHVEDGTVQDITARLDHLARARSAKKAKRQPTIEDTLNRLNVSEMQKEQLSALAREFEQKRLFPQLRDVMRFCAQHGQPIRPKSRQQALPHVLKILSKLSTSQLASLREQVDQGSEGAFARLADAIINGSGADPSRK